MAFCANCGTDIQDAKFCPSCGTQSDAAAAAAPAPQPAAQPAPSASAAPEPQPVSQPRTVTVGQVRKCPACGAPIESFQARCGSCGHELNAATVSQAIKEFTAEVNALDTKIANEKGLPVGKAGESRVLPAGKKSSGLNNFTLGALLGSSMRSSGSSSSRTSTSGKSSSGNKKSGLGIFIIFALIIGLIVSAVLLIVKIVKNFKNAIAVPPLSPSEKAKKSYIENYPIPNSREDFLEFVLFASSKAEGVIDFDQKPTMGDIASAHYWAKVWENKCRKVEDKALIALSGDSATLGTIKKFHDRTKDVYQKISEAKKKAKTKAVVGFVLMLIAVIAVAGVLLYFGVPVLMALLSEI